MKVLLVSHTCMSRTAGQPKLHALASYPDIELTALVPDRMCTYGQWHEAEMPDDAAFRFVAGRTRWHYLLKQWYFLHYTEAVGRLLRETDFDVIDIWEEPWSLATAQVIHSARRLRPRARIIVETEQNIYKHLPPPFQQFQDYSLAHAHACVARNQEAVAVLRRKGWTGPATVVPNAVDCTLFQPLPISERLTVRAELGWGTPDDFLIGYVGRLVPEKGLADALAALTALPPSARLVFVGDGPMRGELETQARRMGLTGRVHFAGNMPLTALPRAMNTLDTLILPSRTTANWKEQFGRVLIEAGACRVPVVGSDSGAIPEVIGDAGLVFPEGDIPALAACLRRLMADPALRAQCGAIGHERARRRFNWQQVAAQMRAVYEETLEAANAAHPDHTPLTSAALRAR